MNDLIFTTAADYMADQNCTDQRCCGSGTCIINSAGECWCGQRWDGQTMLPPAALPCVPDQEPNSSTNPG